MLGLVARGTILPSGILPSGRLAQAAVGGRFFSLFLHLASCMLPEFVIGWGQRCGFAIQDFVVRSLSLGLEALTGLELKLNLSKAYGGCR